MIEDYGTLSKEEVLEEILQELEDETDVDINNLEFSFQGEKLSIQGTIPNEEQYDYLIGVLENHIEPEDYELEIELLEGERPAATKAYPEVHDEVQAEISDKGFPDLDEEDEIDFVDEEDFEDEKW